ncbi:MAG: hypothetical protein IPK54_01140 [Dokdonella sp.]|uniref:hypothetical protein n=1 Tax=Dokdonella sp. TaxID=2291710 RepID=UPI0025BA1726|nr:hypothetical protein [Dokdonella sp.]MBK8122190.1 hypothetical protein [Dokdonella sp.]
MQAEAQHTPRQRTDLYLQAHGRNHTQLHSAGHVPHTLALVGVVRSKVSAAEVEVLLGRVGFSCLCEGKGGIKVNGHVDSSHFCLEEGSD